MKKTQKPIPVGTIRIKTKTLQAYQKTKTGWKKSTKEFPDLLQVIKLFKSHRNFSYLKDPQNPQFLKGQLSSKGLAQGARIPILPDSQKLEKAFSLFSAHLKIHDQDSHDHWDVIYQNKGGTFSYVYTLEKRKQHRNRKYKKVSEFEKVHLTLLKNLTKDCKQHPTSLNLALYLLLKTYMRIGNEIYFKAHKHKGLSTLTKKDIAIKNNIISFNYLGKDGVPILISKRFPSWFTNHLTKLLKAKKQKEFIFTKNDHPLREQDFKHAFHKFTGHEFYPHIVRSHFATIKVKQFLKTNRKVTKEQMQRLFLEVAAALGHKKFNKKTQQWQGHYAVTVNSYVQPELIEEIHARLV